MSLQVNYLSSSVSAGQLPFEDDGNGEQEERRGDHSVEDEDEGVHPHVEGGLGDDEHAGVDQLYDDGDHVRLLRAHLRRFSTNRRKKNTQWSCASPVLCVRMYAVWYSRPDIWVYIPVCFFFVNPLN